MLILAEASASPNAQFLKDWLEVLMYLGGLIATVSVAWHYLTGKSEKTSVGPQPFVVKPHESLVTRSEFEKSHRDLKEDLTKQAGARKGLHQEVAALSGDMKALKATNEHQSAALVELKRDTKDTASAVHQMIGETTQINTQLQQLVLGINKVK